METGLLRCDNNKMSNKSTFIKQFVCIRVYFKITEHSQSDSAGFLLGDCAHYFQDQIYMWHCFEIYKTNVFPSPVLDFCWCAECDYNCVPGTKPGGFLHRKGTTTIFPFVSCHSLWSHLSLLSMERLQWLSKHHTLDLD